MLDRLILKRTAVIVIFLFSWLSVSTNYPCAQTEHKNENVSQANNENPKDNPASPSDAKLTEGKEKYEAGDYEKSISLLEEFISESKNSREKQAEAYYMLVKNFYAVSPERLQDFLNKLWDTNIFFTIDEKDAYLKKIVNNSKQKYMEHIQVDKYVDLADTAFEKGEYDNARYYYQVVALKLPSKTIDQQIKSCEALETKKTDAMQLFDQNQFEKVYSELLTLSKSSPKDDEVKQAIKQIESQKIDPLLQEGENLINQKKYKDAIPLFERALLYNPENSSIQSKLTLCKNKQYENDNMIAREGAKNKKKFPVLWVVLGVAAAAIIAALLLKKKKAKTGSIQFNSTPTGAAIWLDGANTNQVTPYTILNVQEGNHPIILKKDGYYDYSTNVTVTGGKQSTVNGTLSQVPEFVTDLTGDSLVMIEGTTSTFKVKLSSQPSNTITALVARASGDAGINVISGASLTFTTSNYNTYQDVTLQSTPSDDQSETVIRISANGIADKNIRVSKNIGRLEVTPTTSFTPTGTPGGPFSISSTIYKLKNSGNATIKWTGKFKNQANWITLTSLSGDLTKNATLDVTAYLTEAAKNLSVGTYSDILQFKNITNDKGSVDITVQLTITSTQYGLTVNKGLGVNGIPETGYSLKDKGNVIAYSYSLQTGYTNLQVKLDGVSISPSGNFVMNDNHTLTASATPIDNPPTVYIANPSSGQYVWGNQEINVEATDDKEVTKVELYLDGNATPLTTLTTSPYVYLWNTRTLADGLHTVKAIAYDSATPAQTREQQISVIVKNAGIIVTPADAFVPSGNAGGPFSPASISYKIINPSASTTINWTVSVTQPWLNVSLENGSLDPGTYIIITVSVKTNVANSLAPNTYTDTIAITNTTNHNGDTTRGASLIVR